MTSRRMPPHWAAQLGEDDAHSTADVTSAPSQLAEHLSRIFIVPPVTYLPASLVWGFVLDRSVDRLRSSARLRWIVMIVIFWVWFTLWGVMLTLRD